MKKTWLAYAGIGSMIVLTCMFLAFFVTPVFLSPAITIDPITDRNLDAHNRLILTGTTTLPARSFIAIKVDPLSPGPAQKTVSGYPVAQGYVQVIPNAGKNLWKGIVDLSSLQPAEYAISVVTYETGENFTKVESAPIVARQFTLGDETSGPGSIRKRTVTEQPFIRIDHPGGNAPADSRKIIGITSLEPGTSLKWRLDSGTPGMAGTPPVMEGIMQVTPGKEGINRWSFAPNLSGFPPSRCKVTVTGTTGNRTLAGTARDEVVATAEFSLADVGIPASDAGHGSPGFITIDSLPDIRYNGVYIISGTTSISPEDELTFMVHPYASGTEIELMIDPVTKAQVSRNPYTGQNGMADVIQGDKTTNYWAFQLETYMMEPGTYAIKMDNDRYDFATGRLVSGGLNTTRVFTVQEQLS